MFDIRHEKGERILLSGRFDAAQVDKARSFFEDVSESKILDLKDLRYISSAGLGVLLAIQKRLNDDGKSLKLINMTKHVRDVFQITGLDFIFDRE